MRIRPWLGVAFPLVLVLLRAPVGQAAEPFDVDLYARLLAGYTRVVAGAAGTRVDYRGLTRSADWPRLLESLAESRPEKLATPAEKLAFWINAYNILTIDLVVQHYPVSSIKDVGSFVRPVWDLEAGVVGGKTYTLDQVEHEILRPLGEPRIHAAIVCASISCPPLRREPYRAAALDAQLDDSLRRWLSNPATRVVGREVDDPAVPNIEPFGMMLHRLREQRDARHETECLVEVLELELAM